MIWLLLENSFPVGDIVFDPPLTPEELQRIYGLGMSMEERLEQARRQLAEGEDGF